MKLKGIQTKITFWAGLCLLATAAVIVAFAALNMKGEARTTRKASIESAKRLAAASGAQKASHIQASLEDAMTAARTLAETFSGIKDERANLSLDRDALNNILKIILERNPGFAGAYTAWEPNELDGLDEVYMETEGHDKTGRFIPYWSRNKEGEIEVEPLVDYDKQGAGDYYQLPKKTRNECILDPYVHPVQGVPTLIASLVVPIMVGENFYGVAGVDMRLDFLQELADDVQGLYDGAARIAIVSNSGALVAVTGRPGLKGKPMGEMYENHAEILRDIQAGKARMEMTGDALWVFTPLRMGKVDTPWAVNIVIPADKITAMADKQMDSAFVTMWKMIGLGGLCALAALTLLWIVARSVSLPIDRIIDGLGNVSETVASAANQVSTSSQSLAEGSSEQAASIEETSSSLEEMSSMTRQNADNAGEANKLMTETNQVVAEANNSMGELTRSMEAIAGASEETSKIIKTIDEIAFQTNLLALNAAVEAARAGEAGAGFAVVADEVRNLAMRAADAARNTAALIEETLKKVNGGSDLVARTNEAFTRVATRSSRVGDLVGEIAAASDEQAQGVNQVNRAMTEMDQVVQKVAADAEESAGASEEMNSQSGKMRRMVDELTVIVSGDAAKGSNRGRRSSRFERPTKRNASPRRKRGASKNMMQTRPDRKIRENRMLSMKDADLREF